MVQPATTILYRCGAATDALGADLRPASVAVRDGRIIAIGSPGGAGGRGVGSDLPGPVRTVDRPDLLLLPVLVNAHSHLDLTTLGPRPYGGTFVGWIRELIASAPAGPAAAASVARGVEMSRQAGVGVVGDIARSMDSVQALADAASSLTAGVTFAECFGIGAGRSQGKQAMAFLMEKLQQITNPLPPSPPLQGRDSTPPLLSSSHIHPGLEPHAPYSAAAELFDQAADLAQRFDLRLTTHLAETQEELAFVRDAAGPLADLLRDLKRWDASVKPQGVHPVDLISPALARARWVLAHCNYMGDDQIQTLTRRGASVAYCPVASEYFGHRGHRWRDMLAAGVNVCLGTDSILCQPPGEPQPLGILPQMRLLHFRDGAPPETLLAMATIHGLRALRLHESLASLRPGAPAPLGGVRFDPSDPASPLHQIMRNRYPFTPLMTSQETISNP